MSMEVCLKHIQMRLKEIKIRSLTDCQGEKVFSRIIKTINYIFISQTKRTHTFVGFQRAGQDCRPSPNVPRQSLVGQVLNSGFQRSSRILDIPWIFVCETSLVWRKTFWKRKKYQPMMRHCQVSCFRATRGFVWISAQLRLESSLP